MAALLKIIDEHFGGPRHGRVQAVELRLVSERVTPRDIIRRRVEAEVEELNARRQHNEGVARSFLVTTEEGSAEALLNPKPSQWRKPSLIDADTEAERAIAAYAANRFIMLFNDRQLEGLDEEVALTRDSEVVFLFLTPLKGG